MEELNKEDIEKRSTAFLKDVRKASFKHNLSGMLEARALCGYVAQIAVDLHSNSDLPGERLAFLNIWINDAFLFCLQHGIAKSKSLGQAMAKDPCFLVRNFRENIGDKTNGEEKPKSG